MSIEANIGRVRRWAWAAVDLALPPRCVGCGALIDKAGLTCAACWSALSFIAPPYCALCGVPFDFGIEGDHQCAPCLTAPPEFDRARAALLYDEHSRGPILGFKHGDQLQSAAVFGQWLANAGAKLLAEADLIGPVPLHRWRLLGRRYNQAALLAAQVAKLSGVQYVPDLLTRHRSTPSQGALGPAQRARNVAGAFRPNSRHISRIKGARIVLVDDVLTTGATAGACAKVLRRYGAVRVDVLTLARVVKGN